MTLELDESRKSEIANALSGFFSKEFDQNLSTFKATQIVDFMLAQIGPSQYNQGIADARKYLAEKLDDLDIEFNEPETR